MQHKVDENTFPDFFFVSEENALEKLQVRRSEQVMWRLLFLYADLQEIVLCRRYILLKTLKYFFNKFFII